MRGGRRGSLGETLMESVHQSRPFKAMMKRRGSLGEILTAPNMKRRASLGETKIASVHWLYVDYNDDDMALNRQDSQNRSIAEGVRRSTSPADRKPYRGPGPQPPKNGPITAKRGVRPSAGGYSLAAGVKGARNISEAPLMHVSNLDHHERMSSYDSIESNTSNSSSVYREKGNSSDPSSSRTTSPAPSTPIGPIATNPIKPAAAKKSVPSDLKPSDATSRYQASYNYNEVATMLRQSYTNRNEDILTDDIIGCFDTELTNSKVVPMNKLQDNHQNIETDSVPEQKIINTASPHRSPPRSMPIKPISSPIKPSSVSPLQTKPSSTSPNQTRQRSPKRAPSPRSDCSERLKTCKARYTFKAENPRELSFRKKEIIKIRREIDSNWLEGEGATGMVGIFPRNYVEIIESESESPPCQPSVDIEFNDLRIHQPNEKIKEQETTFEPVGSKGCNYVPTYQRSLDSLPKKSSEKYLNELTYNKDNNEKENNRRLEEEIREEERRKEELKRAEDERKVRIEEERRKDEERRRDEARRVAEEKRIAEEVRLEHERQVLDGRRREIERRKEEERIQIEEKRQAEERAREEERKRIAERLRLEERQAEERAREEERKRMAERLRIEEEEERKRELERKREEERMKELERRREEERIQEEARRKEAERLRIEAERLRIEDERLRIEDARRKEAERLRIEDARRKEAERLRQEETQRKEEERRRIKEEERIIKEAEEEEERRQARENKENKVNEMNNMNNNRASTSPYKISDSESVHVVEMDSSFTVVAKYSFKSKDEGELNFKKGAIITVTEEVDENWYYGHTGSDEGLFPCSYVAMETKQNNKQPVLDHVLDHVTQNDHVIQNENRAESVGNRSSSSDDSYLQEGELHIAKYEYEPKNTDELELLKGDIVEVIEKCDDGWFVGTSQRTSLFGTFPGNYVVLYDDDH